MENKLENAQLLLLTSSFLEELLEAAILRVYTKLANKDDKDKLLSPKEACVLFSPPISRTCLHNWTRKGLLTKHHIGKKPFYKKGEIMAAAQTHKKFSRF